MSWNRANKVLPVLFEGPAPSWTSLHMCGSRSCSSSRTLSPYCLESTEKQRVGRTRPRASGLSIPYLLPVPPLISPFSLLTSLPLNVGHVLLRLQSRVTENGLGSGTGWGPEQRVGAQPRGPNGQHIRAGQGLIHTINVVPRNTSTLVTEELPGQRGWTNSNDCYP